MALDQEQTTKFCQHCGAQIDATAKFCTSCGKTVQAQPAVGRPTASGIEDFYRKNKKAIFIGAAALVIIIVISLWMHAANSPFKKVEGYWYSTEYENYMTLESNGDNMDINFYEGRDKETIHGKVLDHTKNSIKLSMEEEGDKAVGTIKIVDDSHLYLSIDFEGYDTESITLQKKSKSDFLQYYSEDQ